MKFRSIAFTFGLSLILAIAGCGGGGSTVGTGGTTATGGAIGTGGTTSTGGSTATGGAAASGGMVGTGGTTNTGGATGSGGATNTGGATGSGGATSSGGATATGGTMAAGGRSGGGGASGAGGRGGGGGASGTGGNAGASGGGGASAMMNFFVTSRGPGMGGNLGGLTGADAFCQMLANAVSPTLGAKMWHAYLSTSTVNARTRIGEGPWRNAAGVVIANNLTDLHDQLTANAALNATWPIGSTAIALDERGNPVPITGPNVHDILTGSNADGTASPNTCSDWTSSATNVTGQVGHTNRMGNNVPSWNSTHATTGCGQPTGTANMAGTVSSGGGRGSIYCFAVP